MSSKYDDDDDDDDDRRSRAGERKCIDNDAKMETISDDEIISKVQEFFFADDSLAKSFEAFVKEKAGIIDAESSEYKLEYTLIYDEFKSIFEAQIEGFIVKKLGVSINRFYEALKVKTDEDADCNAAVFGQILLAVSDFDVFMTMMKEEAAASAHKWYLLHPRAYFMKFVCYVRSTATTKIFLTKWRRTLDRMKCPYQGFKSWLWVFNWLQEMEL